MAGDLRSLALGLGIGVFRLGQGVFVPVAPHIEGIIFGMARHNSLLVAQRHNPLLVLRAPQLCVMARANPLLVTQRANPLVVMARPPSLVEV